MRCGTGIRWPWPCLTSTYFKRVNDQYGHPAGDAVFQHFADHLHHHLRSIDIAGRLGGEEFAVILPETSRAVAVDVLKRVMGSLKGAMVGEPPRHIVYTFSCGIVGRPTQCPVRGPGTAVPG